MEKIKNCKMCGNKFILKHKLHKFCSLHCKTKFHSLNRPHVVKKIVTCKECKKRFLQNRRDKVFCSKECKWQHRNDNKPRLTDKSYRRANEERKKQPNILAREIIYGTLMGDGCLMRQTNNLHRLSIGHCKKQLKYLEFKKRKIGSLFLQKKPSKYIDTRDTINGHKVKILKRVYYYYHSISHGFFTTIYGTFYRHIGGKKVKYITRKTLNLITPTGLLMWFLDDGSINKNGSIFHTLGFSLSEHKAIKIWLWQRFRINCTISNLKKKYYCIRLGKMATNRLMYVFDESPMFKEIPKCMRYKFWVDREPLLEQNYKI